MTVHVLYENPDWMPPLRHALAARGLPVVEHFCDGGTVDIGAQPPEGVWLNRMSPSSHTRGHQGGVQFVRELLSWLEAHERPVINGTSAFALEVSKVRQHAALIAAGIPTPRTFGVVGGPDALRKAASQMEPPFITKHNQGGKGLGVQLFRSHTAFETFLDTGSWASSPDGVDLVQQYISPAEPFITRVEIVDGRFVYAIRSSTEQGFELCPADACQIDEGAFCPAPGLSDGPPTTSDRFQLRDDLTEADPLVQKLVKFTHTHGLGLAGIEFVEDAAGQRWVYDINGTSNYNAEVEARHDLSGMGAVAELCARLLRADAARARAA